MGSVTFRPHPIPISPLVMSLIETGGLFMIETGGLFISLVETLKE